MRLPELLDYRQLAIVPRPMVIRAGGPGSGCHGPNCGRPSKELAEKLIQHERSPYPLTQRQKAVQERFIRQATRDWEGMKAQYRKENGNVLNADNAKELSPDYRANRTDYAIAVHGPASALVKDLYKEELAKPVAPGKQNVVFFTAGGAGVGKTTALVENPAMKKAMDQAHIVYDGTLRPADSAISKIEAALKAGKEAHIAYVHRDPMDAFEGALKRAMKPPEKGGGRTVPLDEFAKQHTSIRDSMAAVIEKYKGNPRVTFTAVDNSHGSGKARIVAFKNLPPAPGAKDYESLRTRLRSALDRAYAEGRVSRKIYKATLGKPHAKEIGMSVEAGKPKSQPFPEAPKPQGSFVVKRMTTKQWGKHVMKLFVQSLNEGAKAGHTPGY